MTKDELVPEIHDILKLCENTKLIEDKDPVSPHSNPHLVYRKITTQNATWDGVCKHHHGKSFETFPDNSDLFLLDMADNLAASTSRVSIPNEDTNDIVFKLWKNFFKETENKFFRPLNLDDILNFILKKPKKEDYFEEYKEFLIQRAEDPKLGTNITSLYTHSVLTGKFYRILKKSNYHVNDVIANKTDVKNIYDKKEMEWNLKIVRIKLKFPQNPFRVQDLNVFKVLESIKEKLNKDLNDFVFFSTYDDFILVLPLNMDVNIIKSFVLKYGFFFELSESIQRVKEIYPDPKKLRKEVDKLKSDVDLKVKKQLKRYPNDKWELIEPGIRKSNEKPWKRKLEELNDRIDKKLLVETTEYNSLLPKIQPPICEICQMAPAKYIRTKNGINENLCEYCWKIQSGGKKLKKLANWTYEDDIRTVWIKISLNFDKLIETLEYLFVDYLRCIKIPNPEENAEIKFSVLSEFQLDYEQFLGQFNRKIILEFNEENVEQILDDFVCLKTSVLSDIIKILNIYNSFIKQFFPRFKDTQESPIKLVISESSVKFPFFEHWKYLNNPQNDIDIKLIGKGEMKIELSKLDDLLKLNLGDKTALHKLAKMAEISKELTYMEIISQKGKKDHPDLQKAIFDKHFDVSDILTYIKIKGD